MYYVVYKSTTGRRLYKKHQSLEVYKSVFEKFLVVKKVQKSPQRYSLSIYKKQRQPHGSNQQIIPHRLNQ